MDNRPIMGVQFFVSNFMGKGKKGGGKSGKPAKQISVLSPEISVLSPEQQLALPLAPTPASSFALSGWEPTSITTYTWGVEPVEPEPQPAKLEPFVPPYMKGLRRRFKVEREGGGG